MNDPTSLSPLPEPKPTKLSHAVINCVGGEVMFLNLWTAQIRTVVDVDVDLDVTEIVCTPAGAWYRVTTPFDASPPWAEPVSELEAVRAIVDEGLQLPDLLLEAVRRLDLEVA